MKMIHYKSALLVLCLFAASNDLGYAQGDGNRTITLPDPDTSGGMSLTESIFARECIRSFNETTLTRDQIAQLLWAGNGSKVDAVTGPTRTAPSAGGLYPVELYVVAGRGMDLAPGIYHYRSDGHSLVQVREGDRRTELSRAALGQRAITDAPVSIVIAAVYERTTGKYGERGRERYVKMEAGHAAQNIFLQVTALELGTVTIGAFDDTRVKQLIGLERAEPLYIMPVGVPGR